MKWPNYAEWIPIRTINILDKQKNILNDTRAWEKLIEQFSKAEGVQQTIHQKNPKIEQTAVKLGFLVKIQDL